MDVIALGAAIASATGFAASTSLQHHAAGSAPEGTKGLGAFVRYLLSTPTWLVGQFLALMSFFLHAVALHFGPLALVQPIVVSGVVIAVPARSALSKRWPSTAELVAVAVATARAGRVPGGQRPERGSQRGCRAGSPFLFTVTGHGRPPGSRCGRASCCRSGCTVRAVPPRCSVSVPASSSASSPGSSS